MLSNEEKKAIGVAASICVVCDVLVKNGLISEDELEKQVKAKDAEITKAVEDELAKRLASQLFSRFEDSTVEVATQSNEEGNAE